MTRGKRFHRRTASDATDLAAFAAVGTVAWPPCEARAQQFAHYLVWRALTPSQRGGPGQGHGAAAPAPVPALSTGPPAAFQASIPPSRLYTSEKPWDWRRLAAIADRAPVWQWRTSG